MVVLEAVLAALAGALCFAVAELQSLVTLEAMASGLPVIAADAMALPHLVRPGVNGYLYRLGDVAALAAHAASLLSRPDGRDRMGAASRTIAASHNVEATLDRFEVLYRTLHAQHRSLALPPPPTVPARDAVLQSARAGD